MNKVLLAIIGPAFLAVGLLSSTTAISDDAADEILIAKGGMGEQMACWGKLQVCLTKEGKDEIVLPNPLNGNFSLVDSECFDVCNPGNNFLTSQCTGDLCYQRCRTAYAIPESSDICDAPPEFASLMDLLKKSPAVDSQPEEAEAEAVDST